MLIEKLNINEAEVLNMKYLNVLSWLDYFKHKSDIDYKNYKHQNKKKR